MGLKDDFFERFGRRKRKLTPEQMKLLREMLVKAYNLVYYILGDTKDNKELAQRALAGLMKDFDRLKHRPVNQRTYRFRKHDPVIRKIALPMDLELASRVFGVTSIYQEYSWHPSTVEDLDVRYCKCVLFASLRHKNAFGPLYGLSNGIHVYGEKDSTVLFDTLMVTVPRIREPWELGNEPLLSNRKSLDQIINDEFRGVIRRDRKGNLIRRPLDQQPVKFIAEYLFNLIGVESADACLGKLKISNQLRDDVESELARLHIVLHWPCYNALVKDAGLDETKDKVGMPEYAIMLKTNGNKSRKAPPLSEDELDSMVNQFQLMIESRRRASSNLIVTVDGIELGATSTQLTEKGEVRFPLNDSAKLVEIWARDDNQPDVLLSAFLLSLDDDHQVLTLEAGQQITFAVNYFEADDGGGRFEVNIGYRETRLSRRYQKLIPNWSKPNLAATLARPGMLAACTAIIVTLSVGLPLIYWLGGFKPISAFWNHQVLKIVKQESHPTGNQKVAPEGGRDSALASATKSPELNPNQSSLASGSPSATSADASPPKEQTAMRVGPPTVRRKLLTDVPSLASIDRIYVESTGVYDHSEVNRQIDSLQMSAIKESQMFELKDNPDEAQARLVIVSDFESISDDKAQAQLITAKDGKVIWYGPLVSIARDRDPGTATSEIRNLVHAITDALVEKKKKALQAKKTPNKSKRRSM